jgi:hypothetical protein
MTSDRGGVAAIDPRTFRFDGEDSCWGSIIKPGKFWDLEFCVWPVLHRI